MKSVISLTIKHSILLDERSLKATYRFMQSKYANVEIEARCVDGTILETKNLDDLLTFDNPNFRKIESLTLHGINGREDYCMLNISSKYYVVSTADLRVVSLSDEISLFIKNEIQNLLKETKASYNWFVTWPSSYILCGTLGATFLLLATLRIFLHFTSPLERAKSTIDLPTDIVVYLNIFSAFFLWAFANRIDHCQKLLYPKVVFLIGRQKDEMARRDKMRSVILNGVILAIVVGVVTNVVSNWLIK